MARPDVTEQVRRLLRDLEGEETSPTMQEIWESYWTCEARHLGSANRTEWAWRSIRDFTGSDGARFRDRRALSITTEIMEEMRTGLKQTVTRRGGPPRPGTINRHFEVPRRMLNWAHENRRLPYNPLASLAMESEADGIRQTALRSEEDLQKILAYCKPIVYALVLTLYDTGCRKMEIFDLRRDQVERDADGDAWIVLAEVDTKTGQNRRPMLTRRALEALEAIPSTGDYYFSKPDGTRYNDRYVYELFQRAVRKSGVRGVRGENIVLHTMRHSMIWQRIVKDRWPNRVVMAQTGIKCERTILRYGHVDMSTVKMLMHDVEARQKTERIGPRKAPAGLLESLVRKLA